MTQANLLWCLPEMEREVADMQLTVFGKPDDELVRPPFGDSRPCTAKQLRRRIEVRKADIANMIAMAAKGCYADGTPA